MANVIVTGAAGFIGSHLVDLLVNAGECVIGIDRLVYGHAHHLRSAERTGRFKLVVADLADPAAGNGELDDAIAGRSFDAVWHLAANSSIAAGIDDPAIDLRDTFITTFNILRLARRHSIRAIAFASTSAIYGPMPGAIEETAGCLFPISNYGAMKLASEAAISAALESFLERAAIFRFPNVVGSRATHGVIYDLLAKLRRNPHELEVLGDGSQRKPYLHVHELLDAMQYIWAAAPERLAFYNVGPEDEGATVEFIAQQVLKATGAPAAIRYTGGDRGWVGDVPRFQYSVEKLRSLGWRPKFRSTEAVEMACRELAGES